MNLWTRGKASRARDAAVLALQTQHRAAHRFESPNQCDVDTLLSHLNALVEQRRSALAQSALVGDEAARTFRGSGFAAFYIALRRSDRTSALAGLEVARDALGAICQRMADMLRPGDRFALYGVEDLLLILPEVDSSGRALLVASRLVQALALPLGDGDRSMRVRPAIGCALFPIHGTDGETLIAAADRACRSARNVEESYCIAERGEEARYEASLARELEAALQGNQLEVWLQPQFDIRSRRFNAAEALIRWPRPEGARPVPPMTVVELAEAQGLMPALTLFVLNTVLRQSALFRLRGIDLKIAVNLSASMLNDPNLPRTVQDTLELWDVAPHHLTLEVTENTLMQDVEGSLATMHALKRIGTGLSLDDFGTGYSSFAYLRRMPLDELKIDQLFVRNLSVLPDGTVNPEHQGDLRIVRSIVDIAHNFDLRTVAEGVEDLNTMRLLEGLGCDVIQGYYTCRPMPIPRIDDWWRDFGSRGL